MIFNRTWQRVWVKVATLAAALVGVAWGVIDHQWPYLTLWLMATILVVISLYRQQMQVRHEVRQFAEAVRYRDFSTYFTTHQTPPNLRAVRDDFNTIIGTFKEISRERETQYHYLQNVLELVDTGIMSYDLATGNVLWVNDTLKNQLQVPYLRSISGLARRYPELAQQLGELKPGERQVITVPLGTSTARLLFSATIFQTNNTRYKLIACQNISEALDENETRAWQRLLRVMTHEIMNSVAPIASLADTLQTRLEEASGQIQDHDEVLEEVKMGIETIKRRSAGLIKFASTYRSLSQVTVLDQRSVYVWELFDSLRRLMQPSLQEMGIGLVTNLPDPTLTLQADPSLFEQVLINLLINATDAVKGRHEPRITLSAALTSDRKEIIIKIIDNGEGIAPEVLDHIFVPFFTTKKHGSGIGLSLCKQIMLLHHGSIQVQSELERGTVFTLMLPVG
jgi:two-component system, NtrC family, nitrogen regulation sensor histidine kinase NtrY